ncbi:MAG: hypothetical protein ACI8UO_004159 [Verrucomicrobiales bacterium]|jgi:hypothetical protein
MFPLRAALLCRPLRDGSGSLLDTRRLPRPTVRRSDSPLKTHRVSLLIGGFPTPPASRPMGRQRGLPRFLTSLSMRAMLLDPGGLSEASPLTASDVLGSGRSTPSPPAVRKVSGLNRFRRMRILLTAHMVPCLRLNLVVRFVISFRCATLRSFPPSKLQDSVWVAG